MVVEVERGSAHDHHHNQEDRHHHRRRGRVALGLGLVLADVAELADEVVLTSAGSFTAGDLVTGAAVLAAAHLGLSL